MSAVNTIAQYIGIILPGATISAIAVALFHFLPIWRGQSIKAEETAVGTWREECGVLRARVDACEAKHRLHMEESSREIKALHEEIFGLRKQNIADQIALINVIVRSVDAPELQTMLRTMESVQSALSSQQQREAENVKRP